MKTLLFAVAASLLFISAPLPSLAQTEVETRQPVMIIRFNQRNVNFERHLATVVQRATQKKSDVIFDIVGLMPANANPNADQNAATNLSRVVGAFHANGVPDTQIAVSRQESPVTTDEVYIFVR